jgi:hypothetical protein
MRTVPSFGHSPPDLLEEGCQYISTRPLVIPVSEDEDLHITKGKLFTANGIDEETGLMVMLYNHNGTTLPLKMPLNKTGPFRKLNADNN